MCAVLNSINLSALICWRLLSCSLTPLRDRPASPKPNATGTGQPISAGSDRSLIQGRESWQTTRAPPSQKPKPRRRRSRTKSSRTRPASRSRSRQRSPRRPTMALAAAGAPSVFERWPRFAMQLSATHSETRGTLACRHLTAALPQRRCANRFLISPSCDSCDATSLQPESYPGATRVHDDRAARSLRCRSGAEPTWTRSRGPLTGADRP